MQFEDTENRAFLSQLRSHRCATWVIIFGLLVGVSGMLWAFSIPGVVLVFAAHPIIVYGLYRGRSKRHAAYSVLALLIVWLTPYAPRLGDLF